MSVRYDRSPTSVRLGPERMVIAQPRPASRVYHVSTPCTSDILAPGSERRGYHELAARSSEWTSEAVLSTPVGFANGRRRAAISDRTCQFASGLLAERRQPMRLPCGVPSVGMFTTTRR